MGTSQQLTKTPFTQPMNATKNSLFATLYGIVMAKTRQKEVTFNDFLSYPFMGS